MRSWRRKLPPSSVVAFLIAGACTVGAFVTVDAAGPAPAGTDLGQPTGVVIAAVDLPAGVTIAADDLGTATIPSSLVPPGAVTDPAAAVGRTAVTPFAPGEVVASTRLALAGGALTVSVPPGLVAIALTPDTAPGGIAAGDRVDVVATYLTARPYAATVGDELTVLSVGPAAATGTAPTLTLVADPFTAEELARADATATLAVAVRGFQPLA